jgi:hypothetical protein
VRATELPPPLTSHQPSCHGYWPLDERSFRWAWSTIAICQAQGSTKIRVSIHFAEPQTPGQLTSLANPLEPDRRPSTNTRKDAVQIFPETKQSVLQTIQQGIEVAHSPSKLPSLLKCFECCFCRPRSIHKAINQNWVTSAVEVKTIPEWALRMLGRGGRSEMFERCGCLHTSIRRSCI